MSHRHQVLNTTPGPSHIVYRNRVHINSYGQSIKADRWDAGLDSIENVRVISIAGSDD